jgi:uncharacterized Tic20 family protein
MAEVDENMQSERNSGKGHQVDQNVNTKQPEASKDARKMAVLCHLLGIVGFFAPLVIWLNEKDKHKFVDEHGQEALDYHMSMMLYFAAAGLLCLIEIGFLLLALLAIIHVIFVGEAAAKASRGEPYRYPIAFRLLR